MAQNRLYIVDPDTGEEFYLLRSSASGWYVNDEDDVIARLNEWLEERDEGASYSGLEPTRLFLRDENHMGEGE